MISLAARLADLPKADRDALLSELSEQELASLEGDWNFWARPEQLWPTEAQKIVWYAGGRGSGKALALDTPLPTPTGWTTMAWVRAGDELLDESGRPCQVVEVHDVLYARECMRVTFDDGSSVVCDSEHLWLTWDKRARKSYGRADVPGIHPRVRSTAEIAQTLWHNSRERNHSVPVAGPLKLPEADVPVDPYVLGFWLGDGSSSNAEVTISDGDAPHVLPLLADGGAPVSGPVKRKPGARCATYPIGGRAYRRDPVTGRMLPNGSLWSMLRSMGVGGRGCKHIPSEYLRSSYDQRLALLQGLLDADGHAYNQNSIELTLTNQRLAADALELIRTLGCRPRMREGRAKLYGRDVGPRWRLGWSSRLPMFTLPRKLAGQRPDAQQVTRTSHRRIASVDPVPSVPVRCVTVDSPSRLYLCGDAMIPTHNTIAGAQIAAGWVRDHPEVNGGIVAPTFQLDALATCIEGESGLLGVLGGQGGPVVRDYNRGEGIIYLRSGAVIYAAGAENGALRIQGKNLGWCWADEVGLWSRKGGDRAWNESIRYAVRKTPALIVATGTPKAGHPLVKSLEADPEIVKRRLRTVDNIDNLDRDWAERVMAKYLGTRLGRQELEGELVDEVEGALWTWAIIERSRWTADEPPTLVRVVVGVDPSGGTGEIGIVGAGVIKSPCRCGNEDVRGPHFAVLADASVLASPERWGRAAVDCYHDLKADRVVAEKNFGGDMVASTLRVADRNVPVRMVQASRGKAQRAEPVAALAEQGRVHHVGVLSELETELATWVPGDNWSPDRLDACVWALTELMERGSMAGVASLPSRRIMESYGER